MTKLLIFSHAAVLEVNRDLFYELSRTHTLDLTIVCPKAWQGDLIRDLRWRASESSSEVRVVPLPVIGSGNGSLFFYPTSVAKELGDWRPDMVFVDEEPWSLAATQAYRAFPTSKRYFYTKQNLRKKLPFPFSALQRRVFRESAGAFSVSAEVTDVLRWKGYAGPVHYLPHSFDPARFRPPTLEAARAMRSQLGLREKSCVVGYFGRLTPEKGLEDLREAMAQLAHTHAPPQIELLVVGDGSLSESWPSQSGIIPVIRRAALPHNIVGSALAAIDILVLPSRTMPRWKEQFGRILVEAMACGVAVVGSDSGEIPHLIARSGGGLVFPERNPAALAACLGELAKAPESRKSMAARGLEFATRELSHVSVARQLGEMLGLSSH